MRLIVLGVAVLEAAAVLGADYITSVRLPDGTTKTFQDAEARQEMQKYLKPESVKAGNNVYVTTNTVGEVTISAVTGTESDFTTNNTELVNTIEVVSPTPGDYANVSNAAMNALSRAEAEAGFTEWVCEPATYNDKTLHVNHGDGEWLLFADRTFLDPPEPGDDTVTNLTFSVYGVTATRTRLPTMADIPTITGNKYDFSTNADLYRAVKDIVEALGGSVTNFPAIP